MLLHDSLTDVSEWSEYVDIVMGSNVIDSCIIYNMRGRVLAQSQIEKEEGDNEDLQLYDGEAAHMVEALCTPLNPKYKSLMIRGQHYDMLLNDGKHGMLLRSGVRKATICRTSKTLIVGLHRVNVSSEEATAAVMNLGDFLITKRM